MWRHDEHYLIANDHSVDDAVCDEYISILGCSSNYCETTSECKCDTRCDCDWFMQYDFGQFEYIQRCIRKVQFVEDDWKQLLVFFEKLCL